MGNECTFFNNTCVVDEFVFVSSTILSVSIFIIFVGSVLLWIMLPLRLRWRRCCPLVSSLSFSSGVNGFCFSIFLSIFLSFFHLMDSNVNVNVLMCVWNYVFFCCCFNSLNDGARWNDARSPFSMRLFTHINRVYRWIIIIHSCNFSFTNNSQCILMKFRCSFGVTVFVPASFTLTL